MGQERLIGAMNQSCGISAGNNKTTLFGSSFSQAVSRAPVWSKGNHKRKEKKILK